MDRIIAVDDRLANVRQALEEQGYQTISIDEGLENADVIVVSGMEENLLGMQDALTQARVIDTAGLNANDVIGEVEKAFDMQ